MSNNKSIDIPKKIDEIVAITHAAVADINIIYSFSLWLNDKFEDLDTEEVNSIYEDFLKSNENIIKKINKILYPSSASNIITRDDKL